MATVSVLELPEMTWKLSKANYYFFICAKLIVFPMSLPASILPSASPCPCLPPPPRPRPRPPPGGPPPPPRCCCRCGRGRRPGRRRGCRDRREREVRSRISRRKEAWRGGGGEDLVAFSSDVGLVRRDQRHCALSKKADDFFSILQLFRRYVLLRMSRRKIAIKSFAFPQPQMSTRDT